MQKVGSMAHKIIGVVMLVCLFNVTACGYFMYPERVGQTGGRIDPAIVVLDAMGLLLGVIPGVVAFAVDVTTGTIYLSPGDKSVIDKHKDRLPNSAYLQIPGIDVINQVPDLDHITQRLSIMLDKPVSAKDIQFYRGIEHTTLALVDSGYSIY